MFLTPIFGYDMEMYRNMPNLGKKRRKKNYFSRKRQKWHVPKLSNLLVEVQDLLVKYDKNFCANRFKCENKRKWPLIWNQWLILPKMAYFCENDEKRHLVKLVNLLTWSAEKVLLGGLELLPPSRLVLILVQKETLLRKTYLYIKEIPH